MFVDAEGELEMVSAGTWYEVKVVVVFVAIREKVVAVGAQVEIAVVE